MSGRTNGTARRHPGIKGRRPDLREFRQKEAQERLNAWQSLPADDQLRSLDARLGKGTGARKQRARILREMSK